MNICPRTQSAGRVFAVELVVFLALAVFPSLNDGSRARGDEVESIPLPGLTIDGRAVKAHTQGLLVLDGAVFITARRDDVKPRRALLLRARKGQGRFDIWDVTAKSPAPPSGADKPDSRDELLDHPGGFDHDGENLWIPIAASRRGGWTRIRAFEIAKLKPDNNPPAPAREILVEDHVGAIAVSTKRSELYGASWDTATVYVWTLDGKLSKKYEKAEFLRDRPRWGNAVQDWKVSGATLYASGLYKGRERDGRPRSVLHAIELQKREILWEARLPDIDGVSPGREGMAIRDSRVYFLPEDLDGEKPNRMFVMSLKSIRNGAKTRSIRR